MYIMLFKGGWLDCTVLGSDWHLDALVPSALFFFCTYLIGFLWSWSQRFEFKVFDGFSMEDWCVCMAIWVQSRVTVACIMRSTQEGESHQPCEGNEIILH